MASSSTPYLLQQLVDDLPLDTPEKQGVTVTCVEAFDQSLYIGTSAHEILHFVSLPPTPNPASVDPPKPSYILATRLQPPASAHASDGAYIKQILVLPTVERALVLSSTGILSFWILPEFSPAFSGTKLKDTLFIGGLDLDEEEREQLPGGAPGDARGKLVMSMGKQTIRVIRIGAQARQTKELPLPNVLTASRRGSIACVGTEANYCLLDVDRGQRIPLSPISTSFGDDPSVPDDGGPTPGHLPGSPPPPEETTGASQLLRPPRSSSLTPTPTRERRHSSATASKEASGGGHGRSTSVGGTSDHPEGDDPLQAGRGGATPRPPRTSSRQNLLSPSNLEIPQPRSGSLGSHASMSSRQETHGGRTSATPSPAEPRATSQSLGRASPSRREKLKPHVASPTPSEFLLTTGTTPDDPGIGMFVNTEGDATRGTISFDKYPNQLIVDGPWVLAVIPSVGLEVQRWDLDDQQDGPLEGWERRGTLATSEKLGIQQVLGLGGTIVPDFARSLGLVHVRLSTTSPEDDLYERRNDEERRIAQRIATVDTKLVAFEGTKVYSIVPRPLVLRLDAVLPDLTTSRNDGIESRVKRILEVLKKTDRIEPNTERSFHEISLIRQKCGLLVLGEILQMTSAMKQAIKPEEIIRAEDALVEGALDPRLVVSLFGEGFVTDIVEGTGGVWVYGSIRDVFVGLKESIRISNLPFTRDALLLLKRYLVAWRRKKGFGSVADEKEVFQTVDAALIRVLLVLDSSQSRPEKGSTIVPEGNIRTELYSLVDSESGVENFERAVEILETFKRLYVLSILYQRRKMYREVLNTWKRILEEGDSAREFTDGEERIKAYLLKMRDPQLVEEYGRWLASRNPRLGIQVFADEKAKVRFEPSTVLNLLKASAPDAVKVYIEYLVVEKKNSAYVNELLMFYLDDLVNTLESSPSASESLKNSYEAYRALENPKPTYREFIRDNTPSADASSSAISWWHNRMRLLELLSGETAYNVADIFPKILRFRDVLVPEMVILYGREGRHDDALRLLTHGLKDFDTAINYCLFGGLSIFETRVVLTDREEQKALFAVLLKEFLKLQDMGERMQQTSTLLDNFGGWLDVVHVLSVIPDSWSIDILSGFLISALRQLVREKAEVSVERGLWRSKNLAVEAEFVEKCDGIGPEVEQQN